MKKLSIPTRPSTFVLLHSMAFVCLIISLLTGLRIQADQPESFAAMLAPVLPQGEVWLWHSLSGLIFISLFSGYLYSSRHKHKRLILQLKNLRTLRKQPLHSVAYSLLLLLVCTSLVTGILQLYDVNTGLLHRLCAYAYIIFILLHVWAHIQQTSMLAVLRVLRPAGNLKLLLSTVAMMLAVLVVATVWFISHPIKLPVKFTSSPIQIDGHANEAAWRKAPAIELLTQHGAHLHQGRSKIKLQALYDKHNLYLYITWQDPTRSQKHLPLLKTKQGWQIQQSQFIRADENQFYEDKFAILLANADALANIKSIHLGKRPLKDQPEALNGRGFHYTTDNQLYDLWHWQSVRSNQHYQADDNHFTQPVEAPQGFPATFAARHNGTYGRYTAGYQKDPPSKYNGVGMNWENYSQDLTQPRRLPIEKEDLASIHKDSINPNSSDQGNWWLAWDDTQPYNAQHDDFAIGSVLPSVLLKSKRVGDRGDVSAHGYWQNGYWHLEIKRALQTHSPYDVALTDQTYLWCAVFDHSQTRHSRHLRPIKLKFD